MEDARETIRRFRKQEADANRYYYRNVVSTDVAEGTRGERHLVERRHAANDIEANARLEERQRLEWRAIKKASRHAPWTTQVLRLILRNGKHREESIWQLMQMMSRSRKRPGKSTSATGRS